MGAQTAQEPSMEDILASIRKIIAEDDQFEGLDPKGNPAAASEYGANGDVRSTNSEDGASSLAKKSDEVDAGIDIPLPDHIPAVLAQRQEKLDANFAIGADLQDPDAGSRDTAKVAQEVQSLEVSAPVNQISSDIVTSDANASQTPLGNAAENMAEATNSADQSFTPVFANVPEVNEGRQNIFQNTTQKEQMKMSQADNSELHPAIRNAMAFQQSGAGTVPMMEPEIFNGSPAPTAALAVEKPVFETAVPMAAQAVETLVSPADDSERRVEERRIHPMRREADLDEEFSSAIVSTKTDDAVANSFEQLKLSTVENLDTDVQAMLRPMLREWLDSNLPSMVERLVRDEIERVSRGE